MVGFNEIPKPMTGAEKFQAGQEIEKQNVDERQKIAQKKVSERIREGLGDKDELQGETLE